MMKEYIKNNPEKKLVYIHYPLTSIHPLAADMAMTVMAAYDFDKKFGPALMDNFIKTDSRSYDDMMRVLKNTMKEVYGDKSETQNKVFKKFIRTKAEHYSDTLEKHMSSIGFITGTPFFVNGNGDVLLPVGKSDGSLSLK